jgi:hypothetical protein
MLARVRAILAILQIAPTGGQHFDQPLIAVLVAQAVGVGIGAVLRGQQVQARGVSSSGRLQRQHRLRRQAHDAQVASCGIVRAHRKAGQALIVDARPASSQA